MGFGPPPPKPPPKKPKSATAQKRDKAAADFDKLKARRSSVFSRRAFFIGCELLAVRLPYGCRAAYFVFVF